MSDEQLGDSYVHRLKIENENLREELYTATTRIDNEWGDGKWDLGKTREEALEAEYDIIARVESELKRRLRDA